MEYTISMKTHIYFLIGLATTLSIVGAGCTATTPATSSVPTNTTNQTISVTTNTVVPETIDSTINSDARLNPNYFNGTVLAGEASPLIEFNQTDYDKAIAEGKVIFLDFYANWCPICRAEAPAIEEGFNGLQNSNVIGFRVNYNDTETDAAEEALADQYGITYQHTKVILKNNQVLTKSQDTWDTATFNTEITKAL